MITREAQIEIAQLLEEFPAVAVLGPRQVGKTTLAEEIATAISPDPNLISNKVTAISLVDMVQELRNIGL